AGRAAPSGREGPDAGGGCGVKQPPRPVIGYVGANPELINWRLIAAVARLRPDWSWAFIGPLRAAGGEMRGLRNVRFFGQKPHNELVKYIRDFDVCIIPYRLDEYTATVVPTKLNEYLAVGKPVVSTNLPAVRRFNPEHGVVLASDEQPECFLEAIEEALRLPKDREAIERRRAVAASGNWQTRFEAMSRLLEAALEAKEGRAEAAPRR
ncbi:MAG: glycosyltransferase, partial [Acidobacteriota bacterium]|nr:glycosyltransferase [Acidobacteriota bacterium]